MIDTISITQHLQLSTSNIKLPRFLEDMHCKQKICAFIELINMIPSLSLGVCWGIKWLGQGKHLVVYQHEIDTDKLTAAVNLKELTFRVQGLCQGC